MRQPKEWHNGFHDVQYFIQLRGVPESRRPINFPGPRTHLVIVRTRRRLLRKTRYLDKGSYEHTQCRGPYGKVRREATRYSRRCG